MAGDRTHRVPKLMVGTDDVATKFATYDAHLADGTKHFLINDAGPAAADEVYSSSKVAADLTAGLAGKADTPITPATDVPADSITVAMLEITNAEVDTYVLSYDAGTGEFEWVDRVKTDGSNLAANSVAESNIDISTAAGVGVDDYCLVWDNGLSKLDYQERAKTDLSNVAAESVDEPMLDAMDAAADTEVLSWNAGAGQFEWIAHTTGGAASYQVKFEAAGAAGYLEDFIPLPSTTSGLELLRMNAGATAWVAGPTLAAIAVGDALKTVRVNSGETGLEYVAGVQRITSNTTLYLAHTGNDTTGDGSVGTPWKTLGKAFQYLEDKIIDHNVLVTISLADGTYALTATDYIMHPQLHQISVIGTSEAGTVLEYATAGTGLIIQGGSLRQLSDLTLDGTATTLAGLYLWRGGGVYELKSVTITDFPTYGIYSDVGAGGGSTINMAGIFAGNNLNVNNCNTGVYVYGPVSMYIKSSDISSNTAYGIIAFTGARVFTQNCTISNNGTEGIRVGQGAVVFAVTATMAGNGTNYNITATTTDVPTYGNGMAMIYRS